MASVWHRNPSVERRYTAALANQISFSDMAIGTSMTVVTVVCDEKPVADKAATGRILSCRAKRGRTMSAVPQAPLRLSLRAGFLEKREKGRTPGLFGQNVKRQTRVLRTG
jgi:hypothetical protein